MMEMGFVLVDFQMAGTETDLVLVLRLMGVNMIGNLPLSLVVVMHRSEEAVDLAVEREMNLLAGEAMEDQIAFVINLAAMMDNFQEVAAVEDLE